MKQKNPDTEIPCQDFTLRRESNRDKNRDILGIYIYFVPVPFVPISVPFCGSHGCDKVVKNHHFVPRRVTKALSLFLFCVCPFFRARREDFPAAASAPGNPIYGANQIGTKIGTKPLYIGKCPCPFFVPIFVRFPGSHGGTKWLRTTTLSHGA